MRARRLAGVGAALVALASAPPAPAGSPPGPASAGAASGPIAVRPHPRLFLSPAILQRVKAKAAANDPDWVGVRRDADRLAGQRVARYDRNAAPSDAIADNYQGMGWLDAITSLGLAYNVTGDEKYARKVVEILREANATAAAGNLDPIEADSGYPTRAAALGVALGFDWVYPRLTAADRAATVATLNKWFDATCAKAFERDGPATSNYYGGHLLGLGAAGYATLGDNPRAAEIVEHTRRSFDTVVRPAFATGALAGGFPLEGYVYGANHNLRLLEYLVLVETATGARPAGLTDYAAKLATNLIHATKPNGWQVPDEADYPGDTSGLLTVDLPVLLADLLAGGPLGARMQQFVATVGTPPEGLHLPRSGVHALLYADPRRPRADVGTAEPLAYHSAGDEHLFMRSSWGPDAVWASFNGGLTQLSGHQALTAGHFAVQRGNDYLLVYAGQLKGKTGLTGRPEQFQTTSAYASTLFIDDGGDYLYKAERYAGGQAPFAETKPFPFIQSADLTWAKLDVTPMYDRQRDQQEPANRSLRAFVRNFVYLAPGTFVVFDRVRVKKPGYTTELRFQLGPQGAPTVTGNLATSVVGGSALHVRALLPRAPALKVAWNTVGYESMNPRLAISSTTPTAELEALTVLSAGDRQAAAPEAALVVAEGGAMVGAHVRPPRLRLAQPGPTSAAELDQVALFGAPVTGRVAAEATVRYRVAATGTSRHHLFDLEPKHGYVVRAAAVPGGVDVTVAPGGGPGTPISSSDAGVLAFEVRGTAVRPLP
jgi:hypothetical protein